MKIVCIGLNHKSAPLDIREKLFFNTEQINAALVELKKSFPDAEFLLLSTCNRVEIFCACKRVGGMEYEQLANFLADFHKLNLNNFRELLYFYSDEDVVRHLLTVASGLDSMVLGEEQILSQVKESYKLACSAKSTGKITNRLFHCAFFTSKKVHTCTGISDGRISVAGVAVELAKKLFAEIAKSKTVVIGAGEMGELLVKHLLHIGCSDITVINRSFEKGNAIARRRGIKAAQWSELNEKIVDSDIVISSVSMKEYLFDRNKMQEIMDKRQNKPVLIIDISVPRNFDPEVAEIENVHLYSIDELSYVAKENLKAREGDISKCMQIISEETCSFMEWFDTIELGPLIGRMKKQFGQITQAELERFFVGIRQEAPCREVLETMVNRIVNKLLHCVISNVESTAKNDSPGEAARLIQNIMSQAEKISSDTQGQSNSISIKAKSNRKCKNRVCDADSSLCSD
ncbi:MAG: glutamyl-tRNA reductase [Sedimentisphaerales bacterium]|nr:glutamyl-tRNA reductase [Sedimentisphaerales bacterium]